jgi:hypothetical protein
MTAQERYNYYNPENWDYEMQSGFEGYRHKNNNNWLHWGTYKEQQFFRKEYEQTLMLLHNFRRDCLPFGEYPDYVILEFLEKHFATQ